MNELRDRYHVPVGFSDHSAKIETCIAAASLGAEILEFHVVFDQNMFGPDSKSSLSIKETKELVKAVRNIEEAIHNPVEKDDNSKFSDLKGIFEKSLAINKDLKANHSITFEDLEAKKPKGYGILASNYENVIGRKIKKDMLKWDFLNEDNIV